MLGDVAARATRARCPASRCATSARERCGIVTFTVDDEDPFALAARLRDEAINISVSTIDFARYDLGARGLDAVARASVHYYNTEDELNRLVARSPRRPPAAGPPEAEQREEAGEHDRGRDHAGAGAVRGEREQRLADRLLVGAASAPSPRP